MKRIRDKYSIIVKVAVCLFTGAGLASVYNPKGIGNLYIVGIVVALSYILEYPITILRANKHVRKYIMFWR